ncbi:MAG: hypothetical protein RLZZ387_4574 [Chloroflexota bacterium]|jgi:aminoglycoside phosphotransferase (APT) family kinase protein
MSTALTYLASNRRRLGLDRYGVGDDPAWVAITPRFRASSHVIVLVLAEGSLTPALAVKMARLPGDGASLDREAAILHTVQAGRPAGYDSIPRVVAYDCYLGHPILVETALAGEPMAAPAVRRDQTACCEAALSWLIEVQSAPLCSADPRWFTRLVEAPLRRLSDALGPSPAEERLLADTWSYAEALREAAIPLVCEHGDLSHPNVLLTGAGRVSVLDWETAELAGLPACDLFFFLTYIAFARRARWGRQGHVEAFHEAFFGPRAWARPYVERYARQIGVPAAALTPLLVLTWARYLAGLLGRLGEGGNAPDDGTTAAWLRGNRYFALWRHAVADAGSLVWNLNAH